VKQSRSWLLVITASLVGIGLVMVFSTSVVLAERYGSPVRLLVKQAAWLGLGLLVMCLAWRIDYHVYQRYWKVVLVLTLAALVAVLIPGAGTRLNGARRWFIFFGFSIQPSEFAKIGVTIFVAAFLCKNHRKLGSFVKGFVPLVGLVAVAFGLIVMEPDAGTALLVGTVAFAMMMVGGVRLKHLVPLVLTAAPVVALAIFAKHDYIERRIAAFLNPGLDPLGAGYQAQQSVLALGSGGLFGKGLGCGQIKNHFLPEAHTDFVLSIVGEELGLLGALLVVALFVGLIYHGMKIAHTAIDRFGFLLTFGLTLFIGLQAAINIAVVTASVPTKGISLPLVSYGGSSLLATMLSLGVILNVSRAAEAVEETDREFVDICGVPEETEYGNELAV
jgi:cell division protein FtsW